MKIADRKDEYRMNGILNIYKEKGFTSHDVVAKLRGILHQKKIGHTGTLDPDAVGVLPVCLGKATRVCDMLTEETKTYETVMLLGVDTDTQDTSGTVLRTGPVDVTEEQVREAASSFVGPYEQVPPMYSALKVNGKKLYELARKGIEVERKARKVQILDLQVLEVDLPRVRMSVTCSRGTYIRTLCYDIGEKLGCPACMEHLTRTRVGIFSVENSHTLAEVEASVKEGGLPVGLVTLDQLFADKAAVVMQPESDALVHNGNIFHVSRMMKKSRKDWRHLQEVRVYDSQEKFVGIYYYNEGYFYLKKMFYDPEA